MNEEIKLTKREPTWNYILNDLALYSLITKVIHSEVATYQDKFDLMYQIELLQKQNTELKGLVGGLREERDYLFNKLSFENQQLKDRINKAIFYTENYISVEEYNEPVKCEFGIVIKLLKGDKE